MPSGTILVLGSDYLTEIDILVATLLDLATFSLHVN
jgi:hypothetical protein